LIAKAEDPKKPKLLIMDNTPLSVLSNLPGALDWLFKPECDVVITDMVLEEVRRERGEGADAMRAARAEFEAWFKRNRHRIQVAPTRIGRKYRQALELWEKAGRPADLRPDEADLGEESVLAKVKMTRELLLPDQTFLILMDDRDGRDAVKLLRTNVDLMSTQTFVQWMAEDFNVKEAETAWVTLERILGDDLDPGPAEDPVYVRKFGI
jgi:hypothetical protein